MGNGKTECNRVFGLIRNRWTECNPVFGLTRFINHNSPPAIEAFRNPSAYKSKRS